MTMSSDWLDGLDHDLAAPTARKAESEITCTACMGSGRWHGRFKSGECYTCGGTGKVTEQKLKRREGARKAKATRTRNLDAKREVFIAEHVRLVEGLRGIAHWHSFAGEMLGKIEEYGSLTDNQIAACERSLEKVAAHRAEIDAEKIAKGGEVDITPIREMFDRVVERGQKRARFIAGDIDLSLAAPHSRNPGAIYVRVGGTYSGKIMGGEFKATREAPVDTLERLKEIAEDPLGIALKHGRMTGRCACCGRELTDPASIEKGIGPVCESKWF